MPVTPQPKFLNIHEVCALVGLGTSYIYAQMKAGMFPRPVNLPGSRCVRWQTEKITAWIKSCTPNHGDPDLSAVRREQGATAAPADP